MSDAEPTDPTPAAPLDLDGIEADLADVELALARLDSGDYWRDEVSGAEIPDDVLAVRPTARRAEA
jgi:RNA polymerase-binding transcription factor DksA